MVLTLWIPQGVCYVQITSPSCLLHLCSTASPPRRDRPQTESWSFSAKDCEHLMLSSQQERTKRQRVAVSPFSRLYIDCNCDVPVSATEPCGTVAVYKLLLNRMCVLLTSLSQGVAAILLLWVRVIIVSSQSYRRFESWNVILVCQICVFLFVFCLPSVLLFRSDCNLAVLLAGICFVCCNLIDDDCWFIFFRINFISKDIFCDLLLLIHSPHFCKVSTWNESKKEELCND